MAFIKKEWKARKGTGLNKFSIDGNTPVSIVNTPDNISQQGDGFTTDNMNGLEARIADGCEGKIYKVYSAMETSPIIETHPNSKFVDLNIKGKTEIVDGKFVSVGYSIGKEIEIPIKMLSEAGEEQKVYPAKSSVSGSGLLSVGDVKDELSYKDKFVIKRCEQVKLVDLNWQEESVGTAWVFSSSDVAFLENGDYLVTPEFTKSPAWVLLQEFPNQIALEDDKIYISIPKTENNVKDYLRNTQTEIIFLKQKVEVYPLVISEIIANGTGRFILNIENAEFEVAVSDVTNKTAQYIEGLLKDGYGTATLGEGAHAEGGWTIARGKVSHAEGSSSEAIGGASHSENYKTKAIGNYSHAEGNITKAEGANAHAEGYNTQAKGENSHAEGQSTLTEGVRSHAEGFNTQALNTASHAEGYSTKASGEVSHSEGRETIAKGTNSHAEGYKTQANGSHSHAEGYETKANAHYSHAAGLRTVTSKEGQTVVGQYNKENKDALFIVGNGTSNTDRHNALEVLADGRVFVNGKELVI